MSRETTSRTIRRAAALAATTSLAVVLSVSQPACLSRPLEPIEPRTTSTLVERYTQSRVDKIDLLLAIDDSGSMADKQSILALAVPDLIGSLANPPCLDAAGAVVEQPSGPLAECPQGSQREFDPVTDVHIGVISTSLGPRGSSVGLEGCASDEARLLTRTLDEQGQGGELDTYQGLGFLAWDPAEQLAPPGEPDADRLGAQLRDLVRGVGERGCGYEAQLESWYRFLVDPEPYASVEREGSKTRLEGVDESLLQQRAAFLRPDSLVAIMLLSDENDCSFRSSGQGFFTAEPESLYALKARAECAVSTDDPCCAPCGHAPAGCPEDRTCADPLPYHHDMSNLHCFAQKQRFGHDFLYPVDRYVTGLTADVVPDREGNLVDNPLLVSTAGGSRYVRPADRVFFAAVVGVPWQDIARSGEDGRPSLEAGLKTAAELAADGTWSVILGDPSTGALPTDPHMIESIEPRRGVSPVTGDRIASPDAPSPMADAINGHEYTVPADDRGGDLQYACIFELPAADQVDCATLAPGTPCDCSNPDDWRKPLCQADDGSYSTLQRRAKAYPGLRQLEVLRGIGDQAIVASICPAELEDRSAAAFGYRPAIAALTERLKEKLLAPCLSRTFTPDDDGAVPCVILEGRKLEGDHTCGCEAAGRQPVSVAYLGAEKAARADRVSQSLGLDCFCELVQLEGEARAACQQQTTDEVMRADGSEVDGWCYLDATTVPAIGNEELVSHCAVGEQRTIRFVGEGAGAMDTTLFLTCQQGQ
ncbi:MAG: hypothetical protein JRI23_33825 [Deltaproteobacteria bacterium]|nr:hypothetical protein [Deltaproteobacteria bacterium]MBW2537272.1 hypothetical protein [Deltaproteobacteria bacterium]